VQERGIHKTRLEAIVTCAAADDITAWCLLAVVIAIKAGDFVGSLYVISLALLCLSNAFIVKPFLKRIGDLYAEKII
jgi:Kef-type K+ transport system membrane component KefB